MVISTGNNTYICIFLMYPDGLIIKQRVGWRKVFRLEQQEVSWFFKESVLPDLYNKAKS